MWATQPQRSLGSAFLSMSLGRKPPGFASLYPGKAGHHDSSLCLENAHVGLACDLESCRPLSWAELCSLPC